MVHAEHSADHHGHHIVPFKTLATVFGGLVVLTILTALTAQIDLGAFNVPLALAIATTKATVVVMFFMALKYDRPVNTLVFSMGILFLGVFLVFTWFDTGFRGDLGNVDSMTIQDRARQEEGLQPQGSRSGAAAAADTVAGPASGADTVATGAGADSVSTGAGSHSDAAGEEAASGH